MRCRFCGSGSLHEDTQRQNFSVGKAVAGAVTFGAVGAAAGFIGKDKKGWRCGACGAFMDAPMDSFTESRIDAAIRDAEAGRGRSMFDYFRGQYANIHANIPAERPSALPAEREIVYVPESAPEPKSRVTVKRSYRSRIWQPDCPIWVEAVVLKKSPDGDLLSFVAWNVGGSRAEEYLKNPVRSVYFQVKAFDDTGDLVSECRCVYQELRVGIGGKLPEDREFPLNTDLAYRVEFKCEKVAFEGDVVWRGEGEPETVVLPDQPELDEGSFPRLRYADSRYAKMAEPGAVAKRFFMPVKGEGYWLCDCGKPVPEGKKCVCCSDGWEDVEKVFSQPYLIERQQTVVKERAAKRAKAVGARLERVKAAREQEETARKDGIYKDAVGCIGSTNPDLLRAAAKKFASIPGWKDADELAKECLERADEMEKKALAEEQERREKAARQAAEQKAKKKKTMAVAIPAAAVLVAFLVLLFTVIAPNAKYKKAEQLLSEGKYDEAADAFRDLNGRKDSAERVIDAIYAKGEAQLAEGDFVGAAKTFLALDGVRDSERQARREVPYAAARAFIAAAERNETALLETAEAIPAALEKAYRDAEKKNSGAPANVALSAPASTSSGAAVPSTGGAASETGAAAPLLKQLSGIADTRAMRLFAAARRILSVALNNGRADSENLAQRIDAGQASRVEEIKQSVYDEASALFDGGEFAEAEKVFLALDAFSDSAERADTCGRAVIYQRAEAAYDAGDYETAYEEFRSRDYRDSLTRAADAAVKNAQKLEKAGELQEAVNWYDKARDDANADRVRWLYIRANENNTDQHTYWYLNNLKGKGDADAQALYNELYPPLTVTVTTNMDMVDYTTNQTAFRFAYRATGKFYVHMKITDGTPDQATLPVEVSAVVADTGKAISSVGVFWYGENQKYANDSYKDKLLRDKWITTSGTLPLTGDDHNYELIIHSTTGAFEDIRIPYSIYW